MSFRTGEDLGSRLVAGLAQVLRISDQWLVEIETGFKWWATEYAQSVWSEPVKSDRGQFRIHCETEFLKGNGHAGTVEIPLAQSMSAATLSAVLYDEASDQYRLHSSAYVHEANSDWVKRAMLAAITQQLIEVERSALDLASKHDLTPASSNHPQSGRRAEPDPAIEYIDRFFKPAGEGQSKWRERKEEWKNARDTIREAGGHCVSDLTSYLKAEFEWDGPTQCGPSRLQVTSAEPHAELGHGLCLSLTLPVMAPSQQRAHAVVEFNTLERTDWTECHDLGSWCVAGSEIAFHAFIPNVAYSSGMLEELARDMSLRVRWANTRLGKAFAV